MITYILATTGSFAANDGAAIEKIIANTNISEAALLIFLFIVNSINQIRRNENHFPFIKVLFF